MRMRMFDECWTRREWLDFSSATTGACEQALRWVQILFKRKRTARLFHDSELKWNGDSSMDVYRGEEPRRSRDGRVVTASDLSILKMKRPPLFSLFYFVNQFSRPNLPKKGHPC